MTTPNSRGRRATGRPLKTPLAVASGYALPDPGLPVTGRKAPGP